MKTSKNQINYQEENSNGWVIVHGNHPDNLKKKLILKHSPTIEKTG
jgi:hypothetical protein